MPVYTPSRNEAKRIADLVAYYVENRNHLDLVLEQLKGHVLNDKVLMGHIHSIKWRTKDPTHLKDKLIRKLREAKTEGKKFKINCENLFLKINDLAGFRVLHLHAR